MSKSVEEIVKDILAKFKELRKQRDDINILPPRWIELEYASKFNSEERENLTLAIKQLVENGLVRDALESVSNTLILTPAGIDKIDR